MALHVKCTLKTLESIEHKNGLHYMPCSIKSDGPANVCKYFKPTVDEKQCMYTFIHPNLTFDSFDCIRDIPSALISLSNTKKKKIYIYTYT